MHAVSSSSATLPEAPLAGKPAVALAVGVCLLLGACQRQPPSPPAPKTQPVPITMPAPPEPAPAEPAPPPVEPEPARRELGPLEAYDRLPRRAEDPRVRWLRIEQRINSDLPAEAHGIITSVARPPKLDVNTSNASRLVLDLDRLPEGVRPSLSLQLDQQGIQITGAAGPQVELVRDSAGLWSVIRKPRPRRP